MSNIQSGTTGSNLFSELLESEYVSNLGQYDSSNNHEIESSSDQKVLAEMSNDSSIQDQSQQMQQSSGIDRSYEGQDNVNGGEANAQQHKENSSKTNGRMSSEIRNLQRQVEQQNKYVNLNIMVVGESGIGKTTFINSFLCHDKRFKFQKVIDDQMKSFVESIYVKTENDQMFELCMIDTPGFGEKLSSFQWEKATKQFIKNKMKEFEALEQSLYSSTIKDNKNLFLQKQKDFKDVRVHCCIYFISGPRLKTVDILHLSQLQKYVNVIPVLAKGDTMTHHEAIELKKQILEMCQENSITLFDFSKVASSSKECLSLLSNGANGSCPPFLIVAGDQQLEDSLNHVYFGRKYEWGTCVIANSSHCDFNLLYNLLLGLACIPLRQSADVVYEKYMKTKEQKYIDIAARKDKAKTQRIFGGVLVAALVVLGFSAWRKK